MIKILLIEDDNGILLPLSAYIKNDGYDLVVCQNGADAMKIFQKERPDLVILDINLPEKNGIEVCREMRNVSTVPIIILSARDSEQDKLELFSLGADDYVAKPFSQRELLARIKAVLKRAEMQKRPKNSRQLSLGGLVLNPKEYLALCHGQEITFTKTEFSILEYCIKNSPGIIKRENIMRDVMGYDNYLYDRTIDTHMKNIRKKLCESVHIETIRGVGYKFSS